MTQDFIKPKGFMTLNILDSEGQVLRSLGHSNSVLPSGQSLLLALLSGKANVKEIALLLGGPQFEPNAEVPMESPDAILPELSKPPVQKMIDKAHLRVSFNGNVEKGGEIMGGGVLVTFTTANDTKKQLYNFAKLDEAVELEPGQSVSVNFELAMA